MQLEQSYKTFLYNYLLVFIKIFVTFSIWDSLIAYDLNQRGSLCLNIIAALIPSGQEINAKTTSLSRYMWIKERSVK